MRSREAPRVAIAANTIDATMIARRRRSIHEA
jgi:hypothetical protein